MRVGEQHEGQAIAVVGAVEDDLAPLLPGQLPAVTATAVVAVSFTQKSHAMMHGLEILGIAEVAVGHRIVKYEAGATHQMTRRAIVDGAVIHEKVVKAAAGIDAARVIKMHGVVDMDQQHVTRTKLRNHQSVFAKACRR